jgi:hypothetical protein
MDAWVERVLADLPPRTARRQLSIPASAAPAKLVECPRCHDDEPESVVEKLGCCFECY